ncbi:MAG: Eco57I restriction-modification methylase domain-containing protein [Actinobacteria bacterium]|nr:SAM-dependent methyltransferase [Propionicimonas sp.]MBU3977338.1 Eco57I restriction-modification methylase domain-containing protein [Actinomycetota bacterium]MBU3985848.1 Eco57I restriction-modification methylase domain-containing protein [Actinomycetota bacterium]MBU4008633.1 Eco57I restriction-modification methylase domain-containing protein [Actinomycetota bacterium]MBU4066217.1 Eco57I restriction-modification methylase domain-containing protein [Actinomycetota bacterium]
MVGVMSAITPHVAPQNYGEVFTRRWVVDALLDLTGYAADSDLGALTAVEPSAGSGAFLLPMVERLAASAKIHGRDLRSLGGAIRAWELQPANVVVLRSGVRQVLVDAGALELDAHHLAHEWIIEGDFLLPDGDDLLTADVAQVKADVVVGNPPYIRFDDLDDAVAAAYRRRWSTMAGRGDIYVGFYERGLGILKPGGKLGFICADRWMRNAYGAKLRAFISRRYAVETLWQMHDVDAFEADVSAYPAVTVLANRQQGAVTVVDTTARFGPVSACAAVAFADSSAEETDGEGFKAARLPSWFEGSDLWPAGGPKEIRLLEDLNERFPTLEQTGGDTRISIGVATGADKAYVVTREAADVEPDRLTPLVMADDIRTGRLVPPRKVLINPWDDEGRLVDIKRYPRMANALASHPSVIARFVAKRNPDDWYRTIDKVYPGLADKPKLLLQDMKAQITPVLEPGGLYPHHNLYYIVSTGWDLEVLGGLLLSRIAQAFIEAYGVKMRGGTLRFQAQYLRKIRVPAPEVIPADITGRLREAFRNYDRDAATRAAEAAYGLPEGGL